jgi:hypothetical protein
MAEHSPSTDPNEPPSSRSTLLRHVILSGALWVTFVVYWRIVLGRGVASEARLSIVILGLFIALQLLLTLAWVAHNRNVSRVHQGRRSGRPASTVRVTKDFLGRSLEPYPPTVDLTRAMVVTVRVDGNVKRFEAGLPLGEARAAIGN